MIGKRLGDYEILREIGQGGQGDIYLAENVHLPGVRVVLKILKSQGQKERFLREATTLAKLEHRNICQMKHFFTHENSLILVVQHIAGSTLKEFVARNQTPDLRNVQSIFAQVLDGLIYAHRHGVTHRDIKPSNIMIDKNGVVKIIDFGIARDIADPRLTVTGTSTGTPQYMAPEQFTEEKIADFTSCDIYSTGVSLYEACCGVLPFTDTNPYLLKEKHCKTDPVAPSKLNRQVSNSLEKVILTAMRKQPNKRYSTAEAMRHALLRASVDEATETKVVVSVRHRVRVALWAIAATVVLAVALLGYQYWPQIKPYLSSPQELQIASQTIEEGQTFAPILLDSLVAGDSSLAGATWTLRGLKDLRIDTVNGNLLPVQPSQDWFGAETVTFFVTKLNGERDSTSALFKVLNVNDPPVVSGTIDQQIKQGESFRTIDLNDLVTDIDDPDSSIDWTWTPAEHLEFKKDPKGDLAVTPQDGWHGTEDVTLIAADRSGAADTIPGSFEVRPRPPGIEPKVTHGSTKEIQREPEQYEVRLHVEPRGSMILDQLGKRYQGSLTQLLDRGSYTFTVFSRDYPIRVVRVDVSSESVDTTIDLTEIYEGADTARLGVAVWKAGEVIPLPVDLNRFSTGKLSTDQLFTVVAGEYVVGIELPDDLVLDSVVFAGRVVDNLPPRLLLKAGADNIVDFYVSTGN